MPVVAALSSRILGAAAVGLMLLTAAVTFLAMGALTALTHTGIVGLLLANAATILVVMAILAFDLGRIVRVAHQRQAGAQLRLRAVSRLALLAAAPTILIAGIAVATAERLIDDPIEIMRPEAERLRRNVQDETEAFSRETVAMARDLTAAKPLFEQDREQFRRLLIDQASFHQFSAAWLINGTGWLVDLGTLPRQSRVTLEPLPEREGEPVVYSAGYRENAIPAIIKLPGYDDLYLLVQRRFEPRLAALFSDSEVATTTLLVFESRRRGVLPAFAMFYAAITLMLLLSTIWVGTNFLIAPPSAR